MQSFSKQSAMNLAPASVDGTSQPMSEEVKRALEYDAYLSRVAANKTSIAKKAKQTKNKSKGTPRRPLSAYNLFFKEQRAAVKDEWHTAARARGKIGAKISFEELAKIIGARWKSINDAERARFQDQAKADSKRYKAEMEVYLRKAGAKEAEETHQQAQAAVTNDAVTEEDRTRGPATSSPAAAVSKEYHECKSDDSVGTSSSATIKPGPVVSQSLSLHEHSSSPTNSTAASLLVGTPRPAAKEQSARPPTHVGGTTGAGDLNIEPLPIVTSCGSYAELFGGCGLNFFNETPAPGSFLSIGGAAAVENQPLPRGNASTAPPSIQVCNMMPFNSACAGATPQRPRQVQFVSQYDNHHHHHHHRIINNNNNPPARTYGFDVAAAAATFSSGGLSARTNAMSAFDSGSSSQHGGQHAALSYWGSSSLEANFVVPPPSSSFVLENTPTSTSTITHTGVNTDINSSRHQHMTWMDPRPIAGRGGPPQQMTKEVGQLYHPAVSSFRLDSILDSVVGRSLSNEIYPGALGPFNV